MANNPEEANDSSENENDFDRTSIRSELSTLSFEELQKLKERMGAKVYNEAIFGPKTNSSSKEVKKVFKRENKNRPREMSSKKPVSMISGVTKSSSKKNEVRDPRFDPLCGQFDKKQFNDDYKFLSELRVKDIKIVKKELRRTDDPERKEQLRRLIQRMKDQSRSEKRNKIKNDETQKEKQIVQQELQQGKQPHFATKSERRVESLVKQYEQLKTEGTARIQRHLRRRQQKLKKKSHRAPTGVK